MSSSPRPVFGKRGVPSRPHVVSFSAPNTLAVAPEHTAILAAARRDLAEQHHDDRPVVVNRSLKAAFLAALAIGCCLAGFDVSGQGGFARLDGVATMLGLQFDPQYLLPGLILLGLVGGARTASMTILIVHGVLKAMDETSLLAYALGGAAAAALFSVSLLVLFAHPPAHGWAIDLAAGAGSGFFYRIFAGSKRVEPPTRLS
jgi:hypothetical protein